MSTPFSAHSDESTEPMVYQMVASSDDNHLTSAFQIYEGQLDLCFIWIEVCLKDDNPIDTG